MTVGSRMHARRQGRRGCSTLERMLPRDANPLTLPAGRLQPQPRADGVGVESDANIPSRTLRSRSSRITDSRNDERLGDDVSHAPGHSEG